MKNLGTICFVVSCSLALVSFAMAGVLLFLKQKGLVLGLVSNGITLGIAALFFWLSSKDLERQVQQTTQLAQGIAQRIIDASKENLASLDEEGRVRAIKEVAGREEIAKVVAQTILNANVFYADVTYDGILEYVTELDWSEEQ